MEAVVGGVVGEGMEGAGVVYDVLGRVLYAGSEAARGIKNMGIKEPKLKENSVDEFVSIIKGDYFENKKDPMESYALVKYMAALWMSAQARKNTDIRFITMSPGATSGTAVMDDMSGFSGTSRLESDDFYLTPEGYRVFTEKYLLKRGYCCENGCRHCPYGFHRRKGRRINKNQNEK